MNPLPDRIAAALSAYSQSVEDHTNASSVPSASKMLACLQGLTTAIAELAAERDRAVAECKLMEHKVITCGVAAHHPDANLTRTGAYADKWDSPQAKDVRKVRSERDAAVAKCAELERELAAARLDRDALQGIIDDAESESGLSAMEESDEHEFPTLPNHIRSIVQERAELERMLRLLTSDLNGTKAKLAGLLAAAKSASELVEDLYGYAITDWAWKYGPEWLAQRDAFRCAIAAAEQGGA